MPDFSPCTDKCEKSFRLYIAAQEAEELANYQLAPSKMHSAAPIPGVVFAVSEDQVKERLYGRGVFDIPLDIYVGTNSEADPDAVAHMAAAGAVIAHLNDKTAVRQALNAPEDPEEDDRAQRDFHVYDYSLRGQPTRVIANGVWETIIKLLVICQGKDNPGG